MALALLAWLGRDRRSLPNAGLTEATDNISSMRAMVTDQAGCLRQVPTRAGCPCYDGRDAKNFPNVKTQTLPSEGSKPNHQAATASRRTPPHRLSSCLSASRIQPRSPTGKLKYRLPP